MQDGEAALRASRAMLAIVARTLAPVLEELSLPQFRVLVVLETAGPTRMGALAERLDVLPSTFSRMVDRLVLAGWVSRAPSSDSRREVIVTISGRGSELVRTVSAKRQAEIDRVLAAVPCAERERVAGAFSAFADAAGEPLVSDLLVLGM